MADQDSVPVPIIQNIVSTVNLDCKLDLKSIAQRARNAEYKPKRFAAVIMRIREPKTTALIFASGKIVCTGAKSKEDSRIASRKYVRIIQKLGFSVSFKDFKIQNIVASCDVGFPVRLEKLQTFHRVPANASVRLAAASTLHFDYEISSQTRGKTPSSTRLYASLLGFNVWAFRYMIRYTFPGMIYRMEQLNVVLLIFLSGKVVVTGAKVIQDTYAAFKKVYPVLKEFRRNT